MSSEKHSHLVRVCLPDDQRSLRARNLSASGVMVEGLRGVSPGTPVMILLPSVGWIEGKVAWSFEDRFGIRFRELLGELPTIAGDPADFICDVYQ